MPKNISGPMQTELNSGGTRLSNFVYITCRNGRTVGLTDFTRGFTAGTYKFFARQGLTISALEQKSDLSVTNLSIRGACSNEGISAEDVRAGIYDYAKVIIFKAIGNDFNFSTWGTIPLPGAFIGEITIEDGTFSMEIRGLSWALKQGIIEVFTPSCRYDFGDSRCQKNLGPLRDTGTVSRVFSQNTFHASLHSLNGGGNYAFGLVTWTSGGNQGSSIEVTSWSGGTGANGTLVLYLAVGRPIKIGDTFRIEPGCDKSFSPTGQGCFLWDNTDNYGGFPFIPGMSFLFDYAEIAP